MPGYSPRDGYNDVSQYFWYININMNAVIRRTVDNHDRTHWIDHACYNPIGMVGNPMCWWKQYGHHFPTLSRLARRFLAISTTSFPVERLFSVTGQVDVARRSCLSSDTMTLLVFLHEALPLVRKIRVSRIVRESLQNYR